MASNKELLAEVAALKAQLEEMRRQPVVVQERIVYVESATVAPTKISRREQILALLFVNETIHKNRIMQETGMSGKNVDSYVCYLRKEGWNIVSENSKYGIGDCANFRKIAALPSAADWMKFRLELIVARENAEALVRAKFSK